MRLELGHLADEVGVEGTARVVSVSAAPAVAAGPGRVCCSLLLPTQGLLVFCDRTA